MKTYAIIAEYNPFHEGHQYQIDQIRKQDPSAYIVVILSTYFVQRGEASFLYPRYKTQVALYHGVDLVIALPTLYSLQSAENFALGAVSILNELSIDYLVFGSESTLEELKKLANVQLNHKDKIKEKVNRYQKTGLNYNSSLIKSSIEIASDNQISIPVDIFQSNNILGLEYIKSLLKLKSSILPMSIKREGRAYNDPNTSENEYSSATAIRKLFTKNPEKTREYIPSLSYDGLKGSNPVKHSTIFNLLKYNLLIQKTSMDQITGYEWGIENHLKKQILRSKNYEDFLNNAITKRYRKPRIRRFILNYLLGNTNSYLDESIDEKPNWVRVYGFNQKGQELLHHFKKRNDILLLTQYKQYIKLNDFAKTQFQKEAVASDLYHFDKGDYQNYFRFTPIIKK